MSKFHLNIQKLVQGEFKIQKVNIAFVFQVNCPGCFIYGIPIINNLYRLFSSNVGFIGVATAFEDFEYNNEANLKLLLDNGTLVGETKKYFKSNYGLSNYSEIPKFPVAFDSIISSEELINSDKIEVICNAIPNFSNFSEKEKEILLMKIKSYYSEIPLIAETFTINQLQGTPSFIIFDDNYNILGHHFGHINEDTLKTRLEHFLS
ncbi:TlpA family protein disulfide reductase [Flavobacterium panici]|uniref:Thiol-disulfide isomerase n=1 Tax=Flavobacterium panici TaxID=2654843 RepID=A0A9N8J1L1_9FLAO|nr:TlpA family protein disulfide reductase [Flavobacterium panici]CAC9974585.1 hypothetical protein FLAPXU55_02282 [Flavobacterium panici]